MEWKGSRNSDNGNANKFTRKLKMMQLVIGILVGASVVFGIVITRTSETAVFRSQANTHIKSLSIHEPPSIKEERIRKIINLELRPVLNDIKDDLKEIKDDLKRR